MWQERSTMKELIDLGSTYYSPLEYQNCLRILFRINQLLGFFTSVKKFLKKISPTATILDVGCGSGLCILHLSRYFPFMKFIGIDTSVDAIQHAQQNLSTWQFPKNNSVSFKQVTVDWKIPSSSVDVIMATLFCHHLTDEEIIHFFKSSLRQVKIAVIIQDLHRSRLSYQLYKLISPLFHNRLITHDGLLSIQRSFTRKELIMLLNKAGVQHYHLSWRFPFCWRMILWKN